jgi:hypothetical protein
VGSKLELPINTEGGKLLDRSKDAEFNQLAMLLVMKSLVDSVDGKHLL